MGRNNHRTIGTAFAVGMGAGKNGKPDRHAALGTAIGISLAKGEKWTFADTCKLGAMLGAAGAFDDDAE